MNDILKAINFGRIIELIVSGIGVLLFFFIQKRQERKAKEKETKFNSYETKKLEAILAFISAYNTVVSKLETGFYYTAYPNIDKIKEFGRDIIPYYDIFFSSYNSIIFFLPSEEAKSFHKIYDDTLGYFKALQKTFLMHTSDFRPEPIDLTEIRETTYNSNQQQLENIGKYFRQFIKS